MLRVVLRVPGGIGTVLGRARRRGDGRGKRPPFSWDRQRAEAAGMDATKSVSDLKAEMSGFRRRMDERHGAGAGDELTRRTFHTSAWYARALGVPADEASRKGPGWKLGEGYVGPEGSTQ